MPSSYVFQRFKYFQDIFILLYLTKTFGSIDITHITEYFYLYIITKRLNQTKPKFIIIIIVFFNKHNIETYDEIVKYQLRGGIKLIYLLYTCHLEPFTHDTIINY